MSISQQENVTELNWISQAICIVAIATGKVSVAILIGRLMGPSKWRKWFLYFLSATVLILATVCIAIIFAQCKPTRALWVPFIGSCWDPKGSNDLYIAVAGISGPSDESCMRLTSSKASYAVVDFSLALLPTTIIWKLKLALRERVALSILLGFGVL